MIAAASAGGVPTAEPAALPPKKRRHDQTGEEATGTEEAPPDGEDQRRHRSRRHHRRRRRVSRPDDADNMCCLKFLRVPQNTSMSFLVALFGKYGKVERIKFGWSDNNDGGHTTVTVRFASQQGSSLGGLQHG